jgi:hypothetical protein
MRVGMGKRVYRKTEEGGGERKDIGGGERDI